MKRITLLIFILTSIVIDANAQFGVKAGYSMSKSTEKDGSFLPGFYVGGLYDIKVSKSFYIQPQLLFSSEGTKYKQGSNTYLTEHAYFAELPVLASYRVYLNNNSSFNFNLGPYASVGLFGKTKHGSIKENTFQSGVERVDYGIKAGIDYEMNHLIYSISYKQGLQDFDIYGKGKTLNLSVGIGYKF